METEVRTFLARMLPELPAGGWMLEMAGHAGSQRHFLRARQQEMTLIVMVWTAADPDWRYCLAIHDALIDAMPQLPRILARDEACGMILEEDLGPLTLKSCAGRIDMAGLYAQTVDALLHWQQAEWQGNAVLGSRVMNEELLLWESNYFATHIVAGHCGRADLLTLEWEADRRALAATVDALPKVWMHRDFQSENILVHDGRIRFVDYQGARPGPIAYDLASLLCDPYMPMLDDTMTEPLLAHFLQATRLDAHAYHACAAQRLMQALGAYGKLSRVDGKERYLAFIPLALRRLAAVVRHLPELTWTHRLVSLLAEEEPLAVDQSPTHW